MLELLDIGLQKFTIQCLGRTVDKAFLTQIHLLCKCCNFEKNLRIATAAIPFRNV